MSIKGKTGIIFTTLITLILLTFLAKNPSQVKSLANHIVISEIQLSGTTSKDEFVELYNPTGSSVDLTDWKLTRKTSGGAESNVVFSISGAIPANGYFLIVHPDYDGGVAEDQVYSATSSGISSNNSVLLYDDQETPVVVDKVGMGETANDPETAYVDNPAKDESVERKASSTSTSTTMGPGGSEETSGNGEDTDNNSVDFYLRTTSDPQNSSSPIENPGAPTVTPTVEPTPTETVTPTPTAEPTPTPTETITPTPTGEPTPTPTVEPTPTDTPSPTPTVEPTPTPEPTPTGRVIAKFGLPGRMKVCTINYEMFKIGFLKVFFPRISCTRV